MTPGFHTAVLEVSVMPSRVAISIDKVFLWCLGPSRMRSVLSELNNNLQNNKLIECSLIISPKGSIYRVKTIDLSIEYCET